MSFPFLLTADWHLTDNPLEEYRWEAFKNIRDIALAHKVLVIVIAGDISDRKDRHSGALLNRLVLEMRRLRAETQCEIFLTSGNHDQPLMGPYYWDFLNLVNVRYITKPELWEGLYLLPFSANPLEDWRDLPLASAKVLIMHQTVAGAMVDGDRIIESTKHPFPILPRGVPAYSGDVHRPQTVSGITYVGTPHPTRFSETWPNRVLVFPRDGYANPISVTLPAIRRAIVDIEKADQLTTLKLKSGDQIRVRYKLTHQTLPTWPIEEDLIRAWAKDTGVMVASIEAQLTESVKQSDLGEGGENTWLIPPDDVIRAFGAEEKLSQEVIEFGLQLLREAQ